MPTLYLSPYQWRTPLTRSRAKLPALGLYQVQQVPINYIRPTRKCWAAGVLAQSAGHNGAIESLRAKLNSLGLTSVC